MALLGWTLLLGQAGTSGGAGTQAADVGRSTLKYFALHCLLLMFLVGL